MDKVPNEINYQIMEDELKDELEDELEFESFEDVAISEFKNIVRICDICGEEMLLSDKDSFICQGCGYHMKVFNKNIQIL
jgi:uncharacterized CHY-type Zn-finger protein